MGGGGGGRGGVVGGCLRPVHAGRSLQRCHASPATRSMLTVVCLSAMPSPRAPHNNHTTQLKRTNSYDSRNNLALLRLYQFYPVLTERVVVENVLMKVRARSQGWLYTRTHAHTLVCARGSTGWLLC